MSPVTTVARRRRRLFAVSGFVALLLVLTSFTGCMNTDQDTTYVALNADRVSHGLPALPMNDAAMAKAQAWANHLARMGTLVHSYLPNGFAPTSWCHLGENIGYGPSAVIIERAYMSSPPHRANILADRWTGVGVGYAKVGGRVYTVEEFIGAC